MRFPSPWNQPPCYFPGEAVICAGSRPAGFPPIIAVPRGKQKGMLAIIAAVLFAIAWVINATGIVTNAWFSVTGLLLLGLACLALHQAGIGSAWVRRR